MAAKKGSTVTKVTTKELRLEVQAPDGSWGMIAVADAEDQPQLDWITDMAASIKKSAIKYRLFERSETVRTQVSDTIIEGEGKET